MADFEIAHNLTSNFEGGFTNNPNDRGNWVDGKLIGTKYGISAPVLKQYLGRTPTAKEMKDLSKETAKEIYRLNYWVPIKGDEILFQKPANEIYDMAVNSGVSTSIKLSQRQYGLKETGFMNKETLSKINNQSL